MENEVVLDANYQPIKKKGKAFPVFSIICGALSLLTGFGTVASFGLLTIIMILGMCFGPPLDVAANFGKIYSNVLTYTLLSVQAVFGILSIILGKKGRKRGFTVSSTVGIVIASISLVIVALCVAVIIIL